MDPFLNLDFYNSKNRIEINQWKYLMNWLNALNNHNLYSIHFKMLIKRIKKFPVSKVSINNS